jgi:hypothetical protein
MNLNNMTLAELNMELAESDGNPVKQLIIKKIINQKQQKRIIGPAKLNKQTEQSYINKIEKEQQDIADHLVNKYCNDDEDDLDFIDSLIDRDNQDNKYDQDNDSPDEDIKFKQEINRDKVNNKLTDRLNSDIDIIKNYKNRTKNKSNMLSPFASTDNSSEFASWQNMNNIPSNDFSNNSLYSRTFNK